MQQAALDRVAENLRAINVKLVEATDLVEAMREAGEDVTDADASLRELNRRKAKWEGMLRGRGYDI